MGFITIYQLPWLWGSDWQNGYENIMEPSLALWYISEKDCPGPTGLDGKYLWEAYAPRREVTGINKWVNIHCYEIWKYPPFNDKLLKSDWFHILSSPHWWCNSINQVIMWSSNYVTH